MEKKEKVSVDAGSTSQANPNLFGGNGELVEKEAKKELRLEDYVPKSEYAELEKKLGQQGNELGELRELFADTAPLFEKLDKNPELVEAILHDKIDPSLIKGVADGAVSVKAAEEVTVAKDEVKKELGDDYSKLSPEQIQKLIDEKVSAKIKDVETRFSRELSEAEKAREYERKVVDFIENTPDYVEYSKEIEEWVEQHPNISDIEVAYEAVKGRVLAQKFEKMEEVRIAKENKDIAANAVGGQSRNSTILNDRNVIDQLISGNINPNKF